MFSCINVSFDIIEYKFVFVRSPCFKCSFCPRRFTTIIYSASFTHTSPHTAFNIPKYLYVSFSSNILILSWFRSSIPSVRYRLPLLVTSMAHFSMPKSITIFWLYIFTACFLFFYSFLFFANSLMLSQDIRWMIFSCDLLSLYTVEHFLSMMLSGILPIMNSNNDSTSPWNISFWMFASAKPFRPAVNSTLQVFIVFFRVFYTSVSWLSFTWVLVTASLLKFPRSSQYSGRPHQSWSLSGLCSFSYFQLFQTSYQAFEIVPSAEIIIDVTITFS